MVCRERGGEVNEKTGEVGGYREEVETILMKKNWREGDIGGTKVERLLRPSILALNSSWSSED